MNTYIVKSELTKDFSILPNSIPRSTKISLVAKGLLFYLLTNSEEWNVYKTKIHVIVNEKKGTVDRAFKELQNIGYIHSVKTKNENNQFTGWTHYIYDKPMENPPLDKDLPMSEISDVGKTMHKRSTNNLLHKLERNTKNKELSIFDKIDESEILENSETTSEQVSVTNKNTAPTFADFWDAYPRKTKKIVAERAWKKLKSSEKFVALEKIDDFCKGKELQFVAHPSTYINQKRWEDEVIEPTKKVEQTSVSKQYVPERDDWF